MIWIFIIVIGRCNVIIVLWIIILIRIISLYNLYSSVAIIGKLVYLSVTNLPFVELNKAVSDGGVSNIRSLIHLVVLQSLYRHTHKHTET